LVGVQAIALTLGWHVSQGLAGFAAPVAYTSPATAHWTAQWPDAQTSPLPQAVPSATGVHDDVLADGWQDRQALPGSSCPVFCWAPPISQHEAPVQSLWTVELKSLDLQPAPIATAMPSAMTPTPNDLAPGPCTDRRIAAILQG
jgi:hypothetical protein